MGLSDSSAGSSYTSVVSIQIDFNTYNKMFSKGPCAPKWAGCDAVPRK